MRILFVYLGNYVCYLLVKVRRNHRNFVYLVCCLYFSSLSFNIYANLVDCELKSPPELRNVLALVSKFNTVV